MPCLACFLDDENHVLLKRIAQDSTEMFEHTLEVYKEEILRYFDRIDTDSRSCPIHSEFHSNIHGYLEQIQNSKISVKDTIEDVFSSIREVFSDWVQGTTSDAMKKLEDALFPPELSPLLSDSDIQYRLFYRGRLSEDVLSGEDLYHIPFTRRHLIRNQRYSLSGHPLLYLSTSIIPIFFEMGVTEKNKHLLQVSSFIKRQPDTNWKILSVTNPFNNIAFTNSLINLFPKLSSDTEVQGNTHIQGLINDTSSTLLLPNAYEQHLKAFILTLIMSFPRRSHLYASFHEEYVLPQMITEIARRKNYDGILYHSTRINRSLVRFSNRQYYNNRHRENLALFTHFDHRFLHDESLLNQFAIDQPIRYQDIPFIDDVQFNHISQQLLEAYIQSSVDVIPQKSAAFEFGYGVMNLFLSSTEILNSSINNFQSFHEHPLGIYQKYLHYIAMNTLLRGVPQ